MQRPLSESSLHRPTAALSVGLSLELTGTTVTSSSFWRRADRRRSARFCDSAEVGARLSAVIALLPEVSIAHLSAGLSGILACASSLLRNGSNTRPATG